MPRRPRRGKPAQAVAIEQEPNLLMRMLLRSPKDTFAGVVAFGGVMAIIINATFLQAGRHPSPMFGSAEKVLLTAPTPVAEVPAQPLLPRARPAEAESVKPVEVKPVETKAVETPKAVAATKTAGVARPPAAIPVHHDPVGDLINSTRRVSQVQRALTEYGYGQFKPTGNVGPETQAAIRKFEADRKKPQTGKVSDWLVHELVKLTGRPIE